MTSAVIAQKLFWCFAAIVPYYLPPTKWFLDYPLKIMATILVFIIAFAPMGA
ncbi:hypothetical protein P10VF_218 [Rhizobium phage vB_RleM_P10VF]|uniref:Uncharacterized protein n=1 Tax=Rhizobium phage vB_RleM_P10VF TaxID=1527770 RepID=A0A076YQE4_9CAUD|nr:hypothetical protein P10VF_218 [Rhizobium phage vB_RleM_P10VF]AIK68431.1 hypothetical protein P10VF_218 [Rhizobium phage vB_RleM_P10VF]